MDKKSWVCTLIIQLSLCFGLYLALNLGHPQSYPQPNHIYFISVTGGFRPPKQQTHLLHLMKKVINAYKVAFVINVSEQGEDDPLLQNATRYFNALKAPWYTTTSPRGGKSDFYVKKVKISNGKTLDFIALNTKSIQDFASEDVNVRIEWLRRTLESSNSNWHIAAGFHPLVCNQSSEQTQAKENDVLHHMLLKLGADAYLSGQSCTADARISGPFFMSINQRLYPTKEMTKMFLLHRISPLEIVTYGVSFKGNIVHETTIKPRGKEVM